MATFALKNFQFTPVSPRLADTNSGRIGSKFVEYQSMDAGSHQGPTPGRP